MDSISILTQRWEEIARALGFLFSQEDSIVLKQYEGRLTLIKIDDKTIDYYYGAGLCSKVFGPVTDVTIAPDGGKAILHSKVDGIERRLRLHVSKAPKLIESQLTGAPG